MEKELGVNMLPQNMPGAAATLGTKFVLDATPDGYIIGLSSGSAAGFQPLISDAGYSGVEAIQGIAKVGDSVEALAVKADSRWQTIKDFIEEGKMKPNTLKVGVAGELSSTDLRVSLIESSLGVKFVHVPHAGGTGEALTSLLAGRVDAMILDVGIAAPNEGIELRTLAVMSDEPSKVLPDAPTMSSAGYDLPGSSGQLYFVFGPMGMPEDALKTLEAASLKVIESAEFTKFLDDSGILAEPLGIDGTNQDLKKNQDAYDALVDALGLEKQ
jgi:tripartite-type tricarboxylate transporter receptor subunit TctC